MPEDSVERLLDLSEEYQIGKGLDPDDQIKKLIEIDKFPPSEAIKIYNFFVTQETNPQVLLHIVRTIGKYNDKSSAECLTELIQLKGQNQENLNPDDFLKVRCMAATVLGNLKNYNAVVPLLYVMNSQNENYKLRLSAAEALGKIGDRYAVAPLIEIVSNEDEKSVYLRESAAKALGMLGDIRAVDPLISILETKKGLIDKFTFLKERIIEAIGKLGSKNDRTIKALSDALLDEAAYVRLGAVEALSEIDDERALPLVEKMVYDEEEDVARSAVDALYNLAGRDFITDLLNRDDLPGWCRDEIEMILDEDDSEDENDEPEN